MALVLAAENNHIHHNDLLSNLPNSLITAILSLLPFEEAARTSVLSHRWKNMWRTTRKIDLRESYFVKPHHSEQEATIQKQSFVSFVHTFLNNNIADTVDEFKLTFSRPKDNESHLRDAEQWMFFAFTRHPKVLELDFTNPEWVSQKVENHLAQVDLPAIVYGLPNQRFESLKLNCCGFDGPWFVNAGFGARIKNLSLGWMEVRLRDITLLLENCPLLESLTLKKVFNLECINISMPVSSKLERLDVENCICFVESFQVYAPNLTSLKYAGKSGHFIVDVSDHLDELELDFGLETEFIPCTDYIYRLLVTLGHVRVLTVCSYFLQVIPHGEEPLRVEVPMNVRHLILRTQVHEYELCGIAFILNSCPFLEKLSIEITPTQIFEEDYVHPYDFTGFYVYYCITKSLRIVEMNGYRGTREEIYLLQYVILHGSVMERLSVHVSREPSYDTNALMEGARKQFLKLNKASQNLEIVIS